MCESRKKARIESGFQTLEPNLPVLGLAGILPGGRLADPAALVAEARGAVATLLVVRECFDLTVRRETMPDLRILAQATLGARSDSRRDRDVLATSIPDRHGLLLRSRRRNYRRSRNVHRVAVDGRGHNHPLRHRDPPQKRRTVLRIRHDCKRFTTANREIFRNPHVSSRNRCAIYLTHITTLCQVCQCMKKAPFWGPFHGYASLVVTTGALSQKPGLLELLPAPWMQTVLPCPECSRASSSP